MCIDVVHGVQRKALFDLGVWGDEDVRKGHEEREGFAVLRMSKRTIRSCTLALGCPPDRRASLVA